MIRTEFCPYCEEDQPIETIERNEEVTVRGEVFTVPAIVHRCTHCGDEFARSTDALDPVDEAFSLYREKHGMLSPSEIREFRRKYELTQKELSSLLGWGAVTLSRYENGALQDAAHDRQLQAAMTVEGLKKLILLNPGSLDSEKRERLLEVLDSKRGLRSGMLACVEDRLSEMAPCVLNGFRRFSAGRFSAVIAAFLEYGGVYKTKLNKLLFYADFLHFREHGVSITGCRYAKLQYGPVPDDFKTLLSVLEEEAGVLRTEVEEFPGKDYKGEPVHLVNPPNDYDLTTEEKETVHQVWQLFQRYGAREIADLSHSFQGWIETDPSKLISYEYADSLELPG